MRRAIGLRENFDGPELRRLAKASKDAGQSRRFLALAEIYDGGRHKDAARIGDVVYFLVALIFPVRSINMPASACDSST